MTLMHWARVVCFVKTLETSPLRSLGVWVLTFVALHRQNSESKVCQRNGARSAHVGLQYTLCPRCMCLIRAFTHCGAFPVSPFTLSFPSQVKKKELVLLLAFAVALK